MKNFLLYVYHSWKTKMRSSIYLKNANHWIKLRPGVAEKIREKGVRYIVWLDGDTDKVAGGSSMSCAAGPGGGGCFGFAWWQKDADYDASVWDLKELESSGTVSADVSGTSFMPALVIPLPLIARTQARACKTLADQLHNFIVQEESA